MNHSFDEKETIDSILKIKEKLGKRLLILTHHYQRRSIVELGDYRGDSFGLSQKAAADAAAEFIVFCGVHFMAESAAILSRPHQTVQLPDIEAGCWMADMADSILVDRSWRDVAGVVDEKTVIPMVYMNADADIKAFCGRRNGLVCTSSNARAAFEWAFDRGEKVFFFPDQHLGRNTAIDMGLQAEDMIVWDPTRKHGGNTEEQIQRAKVILWNGYCLVHTRFKTEHIQDMRRQHPGATVVVHPECTQEVVKMADAVGSTSFIVKQVQQAPAGDTVIIGTEFNLVDRLAAEYPDKKILALHRSVCPNMFKINPQNLLATLEEIGTRNVITVPESIKQDARIALDRMLAL